MKGENIIKAFGLLDDKIVEEAIHIEQNIRKRHFSKLRWAAVIAVIIGITFASVFTVNAAFRQWVISLFRLQVTEEVPVPDQGTEKEMQEAESNQNRIFLYSANDIEDIFDVQYLQSDAFLDMTGNLFYYSNINGTREFYAVSEGKFVPAGKKEIKREVTLFGITGVIDYDYCIYDGITVFVENERNKSMLNEEDEVMFGLEKLKSNSTYLKVYINPQRDEWSYPVRYDLKSGEMTDCMEGITVNEILLKDYSYLTQWESTDDKVFTVSLGTSMEEKKYYLVDTESKTAVSFEKLSGISNIISMKIVEGKFMLQEMCSENSFNYYCYDLETDTVTKIYENAKYWSSAEKNETGLFIRFTAGRYDFVKNNDEIYLSDELTGEKIEVEGITEELAESVLINSTGDKLLVSIFGGGVIRQIGVIDLKEMKFYLLNRKNVTGMKEYSIGWNDDEHIVINAADEQSSKSCVYLYSLKNK